MGKVRAKTGMMPDVLTAGGRQIDIEAHRNTPLHELPGTWCKDCTVHTIKRNAVSGPASPAPSAPTSDDESPSVPRKELPTSDINKGDCLHEETGL